MKKYLILPLIGLMISGAANALTADEQEIHDAIKESCSEGNFYDPGDAIGTCFLNDPCDYDRNNAAQKKLMQPFCRHFNNANVTPKMKQELGNAFCGDSGYTIATDNDTKLIYKCNDNRRFSVKDFYQMDDIDVQRKLIGYCDGFYGENTNSGVSQYIHVYLSCKTSEKICNGYIKTLVSLMDDFTDAKVTYENGLCKIEGDDENLRKKWDNQ